ncbi:MULTISPECIES: bifunctional 4-hydroxy-2-oxoglutarate aldolase/2-dehydro-3-deoxy-phosphogluconate aldolase [Lichenihabitans]|uniref:bifunctional 4-hydroxy-2-oxoglutarate aldolase/2-dehydro-3-deoxy-phosphogluconate aldolase n=1 Tax=Lichenihabitans TaxID=2723776 RepID=UPI00103577A1|nr:MULTISPECIES: bifunctional 4-hydroxy-2-oxoglutarate aldolase/2-dehydro-3-deoxy-phosphogluconate aldolase [Lichenihabitans]UDL96321.1 bifunctional 4-hydroxy-2-oxoglutarate aldolase/2-dehydro-3-deoxy-phosphogluconate aldolase [Lichenihabitans sp. PAMC28606]
MTPTLTARLDAIMTDGPVISVVTIDDVAHAVPLARALIAGGVRVIEVTLRTPAGLEAIRRIAAEVPEAVLGAGTVLSGQQARQSEQAGASFLVSPGLTERLLGETAELSIPLLPGIATAGEAMLAAEGGLTRLKFFPAEPAGGVPMLKALHGPLRDLVFCPTGGIDIAKAASYLACPNVACVGGSWLTPSRAMAAGDWAAITEGARQTVLQLGPKAA